MQIPSGIYMKLFSLLPSSCVLQLQRTHQNFRSTLRFSMQLKKLPPQLNSKESALLLFECLSKCHPLSDQRSGYRIWPFFSPSPTIFNLQTAQVV